MGLRQIAAMHNGWTPHQVRGDRKVCHPGPDPGSMNLSSRAPTRDSCICHPGPRPGIHPPKTWTPDQVQGDSKKNGDLTPINDSQKNGDLTPINVQRINRDLPPNESKQLEWL
jgi:hypothetical protein